MDTVHVNDDKIFAEYIFNSIVFEKPVLKKKNTICCSILKAG